MNDNQFSGHSSSDDLSDFEQRLREFQPIPPRTSWEDIESSMVDDQKVATPQSQSLVWSKIITHAAATLAGIALGVVLMLLWKFGGVIDATHNSGVAEQTLNKSADFENLQDVKQEADANDEPAVFLIANHKRRGPIRRGPLTPLDRNIEFRNWQNVSYRRLSPNSEPVFTGPSDVRKPMNAPQLLRQLLDEQSEVSKGREAIKNSG